MSQQSVDQLRFSFLAQKPVVVQSRPQPISGDAGLPPIRQFDHGWRYSQRLAACLIDRRIDPSHSHEQMTRQRIYGILAGYADCNDHGNRSHFFGESGGDAPIIMAWTRTGVSRNWKGKWLS